MHYSLRLPELGCDPFELTDLKAGESFKRWQAAPNEVLLADRAYARRKSRLAAERAQRKARRKAQTHQHQVSADALELSKYVLVLTNLEPERWSAAQGRCLS